MNSTSRQSPLVIALYLNAILMAAILVVLCTRSTSPVAFAAAPAPQPIAGGANLYLMPAQFSANRWGCYVMDIDTQTLLAYYYSPRSDGTDLQLVAARKISYDRRLTNFNSTTPSWMEVKKWVDQSNQQMRGSDAVVPNGGKSGFDTRNQDKGSPDVGPLDKNPQDKTPADRAIQDKNPVGPQDAGSPGKNN